MVMLLSGSQRFSFHYLFNMGHGRNEMKTEVVKYSSAPSNIAADRLAIWTFAMLTKGTRGEYPLQNVRLNLQPDGQDNFHPDGTLQLNVSPPKNSRNSKPVPESIRIHREMKAISVQLRKDASFIKRYFSHSITAEDLAEAIERLTRLLVDLARKDATALHRLFGTALLSVIELETLSFRKDSLRLIQAEASKQSLWPVPYSPHPRRKRELDKTMWKIRLGEHNFQKLWGARDTDKSVAGKFARRMGSTLWMIYSMPGLKFALLQPAGSNPAQLLSQGWHLWMIRLCQLPELTQPSASAWFEVGWEALKDATGGNVASIPELAKLGESSAAYARRKATTDLGKFGKQTSRIQDQIEKLLRKAFLARFGNPF
ncbi:MAG: hypothetical protein ACLP2Y_03875 [Limisphaerales bacterium]